MNDIQFKIDSAYRTLSDMGVTLKKYTFTSPERKTANVDVPFSNSRLNCMAGLTSNAVYKNRKATISCKIEYENAHDVLETFVTLTNTIHGKNIKFNTVADFTAERFLYEGRAEVSTLSTADEAWVFNIEIDAKPYATFDPPVDSEGYTLVFYKELTNTQAGINNRSCYVPIHYPLGEGVGVKFSGSITWDGTTDFYRRVGGNTIITGTMTSSTVDQDNGLSLGNWNPAISGSTNTRYLSSRLKVVGQQAMWNAYHTIVKTDNVTNVLKFTQECNFLNDNFYRCKHSNTVLGITTNKGVSMGFNDRNYLEDWVGTSTCYVLQHTYHILPMPRTVGEIYFSKWGEITHHWIPCKRNGVTGMYDIVNDTFNARQGEGSTLIQTGTDLKETRRL